MNIQKSYQNDNNTLYILPTPIGNLEDITIRTLNILKELDVLFCEDTRVTQKLLNYYELKLDLFAYHTHNEKEAASKILEKLQKQNVGLVSDAGMPLISDPGVLVIDKVREAGYNVVTLPGASAFVVGGVSSGFISKEFIFYGFLNKQPSKRMNEIQEIINNTFPTIIYETPHKLISTLEQINNLNPNKELFIAREISKIFEEYDKGTAEELLKYYSEKTPKGEIVIVFSPHQEDDISLKNIDPMVYYRKLINDGAIKKEAIKKTAKLMRVNKNEIYQLVLEQENNE